MDQDLEEEDVSWGVGFAWRDERVEYQANELDVFDEGVEVSAFVQTTRTVSPGSTPPCSAGSSST